MELSQIYQPIEKELTKVEDLLMTSLKTTRHKSILKIGTYLLDSGGKRIRPALVILSSFATLGQRRKIGHQLTKIAAAVELIHIASLIHDDVVDHSTLRHNKPSINAKWGEDVSIALGDYLYSVGFALISSCKNTDILACISQATKSMCEGELVQICERDNLSLSKDKYILIVKKKTANLFAASCQAGAIISNSPFSLESALKAYGLNFGIAFQIIDDYLDLVGEKGKLGKHPGQDITMGEITLPLLNLLNSLDKDQRQRLRRLLESRNKNYLENIKMQLSRSDALLRTKDITLSYINSAKEKLKLLPDSNYRRSLFALADFILQRSIL